MIKDDRFYVIYILERIAAIESYTAGGEAAFFGDGKTRDAVMRNLQTLTESSMRIFAICHC